jgi:hypothetical protein
MQDFLLLDEKLDQVLEIQEQILTALELICKCLKNL